jgi:hypothetical protein
LFAAVRNVMMLPARSTSIHRQETAIVTFRLVRHLGFAVAALAIVAVLGYTFEYQPVINALAH